MPLFMRLRNITLRSVGYDEHTRSCCTADNGCCGLHVAKHPTAIFPEMNKPGTSNLYIMRRYEVETITTTRELANLYGKLPHTVE